MTMEFKEKETLGLDWSLEVRRSGILIGHIRKHPTSGIYRYFDGPRNELTSSLEDEDLAKLKRKVSDTP